MFKLQSIIFLPLAIFVSLFSGVFGIKGWGYWETVLFTLTLSIVGYTMYLLFQIIAYSKDLKCKQKRVETVKVVGKTVKGGNKTLLTDNISIQRINLYDKNAFDRIQEGDVLHIEETLNRRYLLRIERNGQSLLLFS